MNIYESKNVTFKASSLSSRLLDEFNSTQSNKTLGSKSNEIIEVIGVQLLYAKKELAKIITIDIVHAVSKAIYISKYDNLISAKEHIISSINSYNLISSDVIGEDIIDTVIPLSEFHCYALLNICNELVQNPNSDTINYFQ